MKRLLLAAFSAAFTFSAGMSTAIAQDGVPQFRPVELWACTFNDRKDQDDMDNVYDMYMGDENETPYAAWQLNPWFVGNRNQQFDFIFLGAWASQSAMGADLASSFAGSGEVDEAWDEAVTCSGLLFASLRIQEVPPAEGAGDNFILTVRDCKTHKGIDNSQALRAINTYNDYRVTNGLTVPTFVWFPAAGNGEADEDYDFKIASAYADAEAWGDAGQWFVDNQAYQARSDISSGILSCDEPRVYVGRTLMDNLN